MKLTATTIKALELPPGVADRTFWDAELGGFGLRLRAGGAARWVVQYDLGGKTRRVTLGTTALLDAGAARTKAKDLLAAIRMGGDPAGEKRVAHSRAAETFGAVLPRYLTGRQHDCRQSTFKQIERRLQKLARPLHPLPLASVDRRTLAGLLTTVATDRGRTAASNLHATLSGYFSWLAGEGLIDRSPMPDVNKPAAGPARDRVPTEDELRTLWAALGPLGDDYADIVRLVILCGSRRGEIGGLQWREINFVSGLIEIPAARMKNGTPHIIPLSQPALDILRRRQRSDRMHVFGNGQGGFQGWSAARAALDKRMPGARPDWTLHDFRRMASTTMNGPLRIAPHIVERCLAHVQRGVGATYNRWTYLDEKCAALALWAEFVMTVVSSQPATVKVVQLQARSS
jgi:integrase